MFDFPTSPAIGTVVTVPDGSYRVWDSQKWRAAPSANVVIPPTGFLPLAGGMLSNPGNLTIQTNKSYAGDTASLSNAALNIAHTASGNISGTGEVDHNSLVINDTLSVNPPANTIATFQAQIDGMTLSLASLVSPPAAVPFTGSIFGNTLTIIPVTGQAAPGLAPGSTVQWAGGTDMVKIAAGPGLWTLYNTWGTVPSQAMTGTPNTFSIMGSISGSTLSSTSAFGPGVLTAGMQVRWNLPTPGSATIITGPVGGPWSLVRSSGDSSTIALQPMLLLGPQPSQTLTWDTSDPDNPGTVVMSGYVTTPAPSHPAKFNLLTDQGTVSLRPMQTIKAGPQRNVIGFSSFLNFGGGDGSRYGWRMNVTQTAAMNAHGNYLPAYIVNRLRYPSGGTDLWAGAKGAGWGGNSVMSFEKAGTSAVGDPGPLNFRGGASWEFDYQCLAGSPDDLAYPKATVASLGGIAVIRGGASTWETPIGEADYAIAISQAGPSVRDQGNNLVLPKRAKYGIRFNGLAGMSVLDPLLGRAIAAVYPPAAFATDGSLGLYPNVAPFGVDWLSMDYTRAPLRWRGGAVLGSATPLPGALMIGGGALSATNSTVSLDVVGSVCTGATVAPGQGGAGLYAGMVCQDDKSGVQVVITGVDGAISPRYGAATTVSLIPGTGQSHNAELPLNPVQFRPMGNPASFLAPGPTGPKLTLTWTAPTTLALQPSGGATTFGGPVSYTATGGTTPRTAQDRAADVVNVRDYGAVGNNIADDTVAFRAAVSVLRTSGGGTLFIPAGTYRLNAPILLPSDTLVRGVGANSLLSALSTWTNDTVMSGTGRVMFSNDHYGTLPVIDENITIEDVAFSWASRNDGDTHSVRFCAAKNVTVRGCVSSFGGDLAAFIAVNIGLMEANTSYQAINCPYDVWGGSKNIRIIGNHAESSVLVGQLVNFNATGGTTLADPNTSAHCIIANNTLTNTGSGSGSINLDPMGTGNTVSDVLVTGNVITGGLIHALGNAQDITISHNLLNGVNTTSAIYSYISGGDTPQNIQVLNNTIVNPSTASGNLAVIRIEANGYLIQSNTVTGSSHYRACYTGAAVGTLGVNNFTAGTSTLRVTSASSSSQESGPLIVTGTLRVNGNIGFNNTAPLTKPSIAGSRSGNAALADLLTKLAATGLIADTTTA